MLKHFSQVSINIMRITFDSPKFATCLTKKPYESLSRLFYSTTLILPKDAFQLQRSGNKSYEKLDTLEEIEQKIISLRMGLTGGGAILPMLK